MRSHEISLKQSNRLGAAAPYRERATKTISQMTARNAFPDEATETSVRLQALRVEMMPTGL